MSKLYAITYDGRSVPFPEELVDSVERHMKNKTPFKLSGIPISGADIRRVERQGAQDFGPHLTSQVSDVFELPAGTESTGFWQEAFRLNTERHKQGLPLLYGSVWEWAKAESGFTRPVDLCEFITAEWWQAEEQNRPELPKPKSDVKRMTNEFYESEAGQAYRQHLGRRGRL